MSLFRASYASPIAALHKMAPNGEPDLQQFTAAAQSQHWGLSMSQIRSIFTGLDENHDGTLTISEILGAFRSGAYYGGGAASESPVVPTGFLDCNDGLQYWKMEWSKEKKDFCSLISRRDLQNHFRDNLSAQQARVYMDTNGDGRVTLSEFIAGASGHRSLVFQPPLIEPKADYAFKAMDMNSDGDLSRGEIEQVIGNRRAPLAEVQDRDGHMTAQELSRRLIKTWYTLPNAFDRMDTDDSHSLTVNELGAGLAEMREPVEQSSEVMHVFKGLDTLGDGKITPPEFHGTLQLGHFFQTKEAVQHALGWDTMTAPAMLPSHHHHSPTPEFLLPSVDASHSISLASLASGIASEYASSEQFFHHMDSHKTQVVTQFEFKAGLQALHPAIGPNAAAWAFHGLDSDEDGVLSEHEFNSIVGQAMEMLKKKTHTNAPEIPQNLHSAEAQFYAQARRWQGSMKKACEQMGLVDGNALPLQNFREAIRPFEPLLSYEVAQDLFHKMDENLDGRLEINECYISLATFRKDAERIHSLRNVFCDADADNDHKLSREEFKQFGYKLHPAASAAKFGTLMDELDRDEDGFVSMEEMEAAVGKEPAQHSSNNVDLEKYQGVPAILEGIAEISTQTAESLPATANNAIGDAFGQTLAQKLGLPVTVAGVHEMPGSSGVGDKRLVVMYTANAADGAAVLATLEQNALDIQNAVETAVDDAIAAEVKITVWSKTTFNFFGPKAGGLRSGSKLTESWGTKPGHMSDNGSPPALA
ncbi:unnamed protein product [Polarella glacialis]|uniref:EF-hand domain-containing protein n=1 Tax=Polarella glacialis TaxID=89957 RepID=A0A813M2W9_POLGL|nr:unnamed protein product [Polarella glacialis]